MANYPPTRTVAAIETLAGQSFPDPYRWLEEDTEEVRAWQKDQARFATEFVQAWPGHADVVEAVSRFTTGATPALPRSAGSHWFRVSSIEGSADSAILVSDEPMGAGRTLFDTRSAGLEPPPTIVWIAPSPDGRTLAFGICADGSEHNSIRLIDVESGQTLPEAPSVMLLDDWAGGVQWLADSSGFYFTGLHDDARAFQQQIFRYDLGSGKDARRIEVPLIGGLDNYMAARPSLNGRWVVVLQRNLTPIPTAVLDLHNEDAGWRPFVTEIDGTLAGHVVGDRYIAVTDVDAPRSRIVAIDLDSETPNDPQTWQEILPQSEAVIRTVRPIGDRLYVTELLDTYGRVRVIGNEGGSAVEVPLPDRGKIAEPYFPLQQACLPSDQVSYVFALSSLTASSGMYLHRPGDLQVETLVAPQVRLEGAKVEDRWAVSHDGTRVPYQVVSIPGSGADQPRPALLHAYGGFNYPLCPEFPGAMASFITAGGLYVLGHIRGGSELGRDWWEGGRHKTKQNCYKDLYAIAEDLVAAGLAPRDKLAMVGESNGGLMAGVVAIQRPDLWAVAVSRVPLTDIMGGCRDPYGRMAVSTDYGNPDDPDEVQRMALFSPYQMVTDDTEYPAFYLDAGDTDTRALAWHARKLGARFQAAQAGPAPILVHVWEGAGHGAATSRDLAVAEHSEWLAFVMQQLGMTPAAT